KSLLVTIIEIVIKKVMNFLRTIRNHWKKTTFLSFAIAYGAKYSKDKYEISKMMRGYCEEALKYGDTIIGPITPPKKLLVLLNPAADKRSAEKNFQNYCEPILHLAGYLVEIVQTDSVGHARRYVEEELKKLPDAIIVAGGDGTISETITGLLRRNDKQLCPVGVLPLGRTNEVVSKLFYANQNNYVEEIKLLADTAIAIIRGKTNKRDVIKIQPLEEEVIENSPSIENPKPIYAMGSLQWGAFRDVINLRDRYWYVGPLREYAAPLFNAFGDKLTWECKAKLLYSPPCSGCSNCRNKNEEINKHKRWWSAFVPRFKLGHQTGEIDYSKIINMECSQQFELDINPTELILEPDLEDTVLSKLTLKIKDEISSGFDFISESWNRIKTNEKGDRKLLEGRTITLMPECKDDKEKFYYIDNEPFEIRPIQISIVPKAINMFVLQ
ncbi:acylglycerol kinase, mitochondrial, partial [Condylostylus longicornis]|uniref:acylglycerol kinase, mitochondrial n=1 Tax=Condylostylus longicornis TaxID=2530218 RepID=UPI00244E08AB